MRKKTLLTETLEEFALPMGIIFFILLVTIVFLIPKIKQGFELRKKIVGQEGKIDKLSQKLADLSTLSEAELFDSSSLLLTALPQEKDFYRTLVMTKQILNKNNIFLESFKFAPGELAEETGKKTSSLSPLSVSVSFAATFEDFMRMLNEVDKILPLVRVEGLKVGSMAATESASLFGFSGKMNLISFYSPLPKVLGKPENALPRISNQDRQLIEELKSFYQYQAEAVSEEPASAGVGRDNPFSL